MGHSQRSTLVSERKEEGEDRSKEGEAKRSNQKNGLIGYRMWLGDGNRKGEKRRKEKKKRKERKRERPRCD